MQTSDALAANGRWATQGILFATGIADLQPESTPVLKEIAETMKQHADLRILIEGHTDAVGSEEDNLSLSDRRAEAVAVVLTESFQIPAENLTTQGYGEQFLKIQTPAPERQNRRVTVRRITPLLAGR